MSTSQPHVFSGEWLDNPDPSCQHRYREGFAGIPAARWNGWQVFTVSPKVMGAIIDSQHTATLQMVTASVTGGAHLHAAWLDALQHLASISWLGDLVVVDTRVLQSDPTHVEVIAPDSEGQYRVSFGWRWDAVDPGDVHTIHAGKDDCGSRPRQWYRAGSTRGEA
ncbi:hypothetical protein [Micromonospora sp. 067-2]|uniref:hypothetical protein n=1 Tax=Micromonospora sp. 067-2 TaxID=2789270 RepID=UPI00397D2FB2